MTISSVYTKDFFDFLQMGVKRSAMAIVPLVVELVHPTSVIDIGCGTGDFLAAFQESGICDILGIDGAYVDRSQLAIPQAQFRALDLSLPFTLERTYDLALCLEVAEHLAPENASSFIESLTRVAPVILFSAAIPFQGGVHHVNEQWPDYWAQLFRKRGYVPVDALRKSIWNKRQIEYWYRQNILLFCSEQALESNTTLERAFRETNQNMLSVVHPEGYLKCNTKALRMARKALNEYVWPLRNMVKKILPTSFM